MMRPAPNTPASGGRVMRLLTLRSGSTARAVLFVLSIGTAVLAQSPAPATPPATGQAATPATQELPPVTFKVEVNYVEVDAVITDQQGNFVRNLTKNDFQVLEDGKPQSVSTFSLVDIPIEHAERP